MALWLFKMILKSGMKIVSVVELDNMATMDKENGVCKGEYI